MMLGFSLYYAHKKLAGDYHFCHIRAQYEKAKNASLTHLPKMKLILSNGLN